jgi:Tfp pilus assembly protein PilX
MAEMTYEDRKRLALADMASDSRIAAAYIISRDQERTCRAMQSYFARKAEFTNACAEEEAEAAKQPKGVCTWTKMGNGNRDTSCGRETSLWAEGICPYCGKEIKPA